MQPTSVDDATRDRQVTAVEILGYAGTAVALVGTGAVVGRFASGSNVVTAVVSLLLAAALLVAGAIVGGAAHERLQRMRSVLWFFAVGAFQSFVGALVQPSSKGAVVLVLALTGIVAAALWFLVRSTLQHVAMYGAFAGAIVVLASPDMSFGLFGFLGVPNLTVTGIVMMVLGWAWFAVGWVGVVPPPRVAMVLGSLTVLLAGLVLSSELQATAFLIMSVGGALLLFLGNMRSDRAVGGIGVAGLLIGLAVFSGDQASGDAGSVVTLIIGVGVIVVAIVLGRRWGAVPKEVPGLGLPPAPPPPPSQPDPA